MVPEVIIVGAGPAGIFAALELLEKGVREILILEKGPPLGDRHCFLEETGECRQCEPCSILSGWGGAGAFSDGKLTLSPQVGGFLEELVGRGRLESLIQEVDRRFLEFGAPSRMYGLPGDEMESLARRCVQAGLRLVPVPVRPMGTHLCSQVLAAFFQHLKAKVKVVFNQEVKTIGVVNGQKEVVTSSGNVYRAPYLLLAPGREGNRWLREQLAPLGVDFKTNPVDVGVRVEVPAEVMEEVTSVAYEAKLLFNAPTFDDEVRTFCMCPNGEVVMEHRSGLFTVNGHSHGGRSTPYTNFALLVRTAFTQPFDSPVAYGEYLARLANLLVGTVIVQRLGDLKMGRRSTPERIGRGLVEPTLAEAVPGDLSFVLPYRYLVGILEMLEAMDRIVPGVNSRHTLLYGIEVKFYSLRPQINQELETPIPGLFVAGDGAGISRGLVQAAASGILAARAMAVKMEG